MIKKKGSANGASFETEDKVQFFSNEKDCAFLFVSNRFPA